MMTCRRGLAWFILAAWGSLWLGAAAFALPLKIAVSRTNLSLPLYVAQAQGLFAAEGLEVELLQCLGGVRCMAELTSGRADVGTSTEIVGALLSFQRRDFALIATFVGSAHDVKLLTRKSAGIASWADLAGRRIATVQGSSAQYYLDAALLFNGVPPQRVDLVLLQPEQVGAALAAGKVDAAAIWEPFAYEARLLLGADAAQLPAQRLYTTTFNLYVMRDTLQRRQAQIVQLLRAVQRAEAFIAAHPAQAQAVLRHALQLDQAFIDAVWSGYDYRLTLRQSLVSTMEAQARWAVRSAQVPAGAVPINMLDIIELAPLRSVAPTAVTIAK